MKDESNAASHGVTHSLGHGRGRVDGPGRGDAKPPRVGITCDNDVITDRRGARVSRYVLQRTYSAAVMAAGGLPVLLPYDLGDWGADTILEGLDGLVFSGGGFDVPPSYYRESPRPALGEVHEERSDFERSLLEEALRRSMPVLGICLGMQLLNVVCGGSLYQDLSERPETDVHVQPHDRALPCHKVQLAASSVLASMYGRDVLEVNSTHHQAVRTMGSGVTVQATSMDGVVEAIAVSAHPFCIGVQWHPEALPAADRNPIFEALLGACVKQRGQSRRCTE